MRLELRQQINLLWDIIQCKYHCFEPLELSVKLGIAFWLLWRTEADRPINGLRKQPTKLRAHGTFYIPCG